MSSRTVDEYGFGFFVDGVDDSIFVRKAIGKEVAEIAD